MSLQQTNPPKPPTLQEQIDEKINNVKAMIDEMWQDSKAFGSHLTQERATHLMELLNNVEANLDYARKTFEVDYYKAKYEECLK